MKWAGEFLKKRKPEATTGISRREDSNSNLRGSSDGNKLEIEDYTIYLK
jgi:hypothetical protein